MALIMCGDGSGKRLRPSERTSDADFVSVFCGRFYVSVSDVQPALLDAGFLYQSSQLHKALCSWSARSISTVSIEYDDELAACSYSSAAALSR